MISWFYRTTREFLRNAVYAANDGVVTTFAVVAGVTGASLEPIAILALGFANLFADGISMASGNYLGTKSEKDLYSKERARHARVFDENKEVFRQHVEKFLAEKGYMDGDLGATADMITRNKRFALDFILHEEMGLAEQESSRPLKGALVTVISFVAAGLVPLFPYLVFSKSDNTFLYAIFFTAITLFVIGASRSFYMGRLWIFAGLEMLIIGGFAATIAYLIGFAVSKIA
jgi:VIT1/CCC1 family predicted Fe2+/Mn2+ transporter